MNSMIEEQITLQPGPLFYEVFLGALMVFGTNLRDWSRLHGFDANNAQMAAMGSWNGPKAKDLRQKMIERVGEDTFRHLIVRAEDRFVLTGAEFKQEVLDLSRELHAAECAARKKFRVGGVPTSHDLHAVDVHMAAQLKTTPETIKAACADQD